MYVRIQVCVKLQKYFLYLPEWKGKRVFFSCNSPWWKHFLLFIFQLGQAKSVPVISIQCFLYQEWDNACCHKMTNCTKYAAEYVITLSISWLAIVFLNHGENRPGQFYFSGPFLIRQRTALFFFSWYSNSVFSTHPFSELYYHTPITSKLASVKTVWTEQRGAL